MRLLSIKSTQSRLGLLIGILVLAAAVNAVLAITQAAAFQQQLAELRRLAGRIDQHADARVSLLKQQDALKLSFITYERGYQAQGEARRYWLELEDYVWNEGYTITESGAVIDPLGDAHRAYDETSLAIYDTAFAEDGSLLDDQLASGIDNVDLAADNLENEIEARLAAEQKQFRDEVAALYASTQRSALAGQAALLVLAVLVVFGVFTTNDIARPIQALIGAVVAFQNKVFEPQLLNNHTRRPDELGQLASAVSEMATSITEQNRQTEAFLTAAQRFVPSQYLDFLEKDNITKVQLGDHVSAEMAVMFSDIRGFTSMSEHMTAKENFDFINEYLKLVSPIINRYEGFIVKFLGDGMMAIFPYGVGDAVQAGIEKQRLVQAFNEQLKQRGLGSITVGIGIHTGPMMVGMIGEELRMQGDAFSDNVNLTSRIEGLNKFYGTSMIISEDTLAQLPKPVTFKMRYLGKAVVKGRVAPLGMYEIYEGLAPAVREVREAIRPNFERGVQLYAEGCFAEAGRLFHQVLERDPSDKTARYYFESCAEWVDQPRPEKWDGAIVMDSK